MLRPPRSGRPGELNRTDLDRETSLHLDTSLLFVTYKLPGNFVLMSPNKREYMKSCTH
jgi:hypothetical protein